jgi:hypothetical protein
MFCTEGNVSGKINWKNCAKFREGGRGSIAGRNALMCGIHGCCTWSFAMREEHMLRVTGNGFPKTIFGPRRDDVTGEWSRLHNEDLHDLYSSPYIVQVIT